MTIIIVIIILASVSIIVVFGGARVVRLREKLEPVIPH